MPNYYQHKIYAFQFAPIIAVRSLLPLNFASTSMKYHKLSSGSELGCQCGRDLGLSMCPASY